MNEEVSLSPEDFGRIAFVIGLLQNEYTLDEIIEVVFEMADRMDQILACKDCSDNVVEKREFLIVHDELEEKVDLTGGKLCVLCFEARLGRKLCYFDFTKHMFDDDMEISELLANRMNNKLEETLFRDDIAKEP